MSDRKVDWVRDREFAQDDIVVTVWRLPLRRPKFRFEIGCRGKEDRVFRSFLVHFSGKGKLRMRHGCRIDVLQSLIVEAEDYIRGEAQATEDARIDRMVAHEERDLNKGKPRQRPGLKQLAKMDAAKRRKSQNLTVEIQETVELTEAAG